MTAKYKHTRQVTNVGTHGKGTKNKIQITCFCNLTAILPKFCKFFNIIQRLYFSKVGIEMYKMNVHQMPVEVKVWNVAHSADILLFNSDRMTDGKEDENVKVKHFVGRIEICKVHSHGQFT